MRCRTYAPLYSRKRTSLEPPSCRLGASRSGRILDCIVMSCIASGDFAMPENMPPALEDLPPHVRLIQMGTQVISRTLYAAAKLGLADQLASGPRSALELAGPMQLHAASLHRLMRTLASVGILTEQSGQRFALTALGEALKVQPLAGPAIDSMVDFVPHRDELLRTEATYK